MARKRSASRKVPFTRSVSRDKITGGRGRGRHGNRVEAAPLLLGRLRRLEFAVLYLCGDAREFDIAKFCKSVLSLEADAKIESRGRNVRGGEVQVPHEGGTKWKAPRASENLRRPESGDEDGELSPFPPGEPDENQ